MKNFNRLLGAFAISISLFCLLSTSGVYAQSTISGTVKYLNSFLRPLDGIKVVLTNPSGLPLDSVQTNEEGYFIFHNVPEGSYYIKPHCTKAWGGGASNDALLIMKHFVGLNILPPLPLKASDLDVSSSVNSVDALLVMKRFVGMINSFLSGDWAFEMDLVVVSGSSNIVHDIKGLCFGDVNGSYNPPGCSPYPTEADAGPDQSAIQGNTATLAANIPTSGTGEWKIITGPGGMLTDPANPNSTFTGLSGTAYQLVWTITTSCFISYDTVEISFVPALGLPCPGIPSFLYGGQTYNTVKIGTQCWMKENLNVGSYVASINTGSSHSDVSNNGIIEKYCYNNEQANCIIYGGLYDWDEMMSYTATAGAQGICPAGWHIPAEAEWTILTTYLGGDNLAGGKMKETGITHWFSPNDGATNESGFTALGAGVRYYGGNSGDLHFQGCFWSSTPDNIEGALYLSLTAFQPVVYHYDYGQLRTTGISVRCLKDTCASPTSSDAGPDQINIAGNSATLAANSPGTGETGTWNIVSGSGGSLVNINDPATTFSGAPGETYHLIWSISNTCQISIDSVEISFVSTIEQPCPGTPSFSYSGQTYNTVQIGMQCWMKENLNIGTMIYGSQNAANNTVIEKYCYDNEPANCTIYGGFYQWDEVMQYTTAPGSQGICPSGWHIPSDVEWCTLATSLDATVDCNVNGATGNNAGGKMKETGITHWNSPNTGATNESGFTAFGTGFRIFYGAFGELNQGANFWTSSDNSTLNGIRWGMNFGSANIRREYLPKVLGLSVRCLKDPCASPTSSDAGPDQINIAGNSATLAANSPGTGETGTWNIVSGSGGSLVNINDPATTFSGASGETYHLTWSITNACQTSIDTVIISFVAPPAPCPEIPTVSYGGQTYNTVQIGTQCWMRENLNIGTMIDVNQEQINNSIIEKYCYNNDTANCTIYGGLYEWDELMDYVTTDSARGICPLGWHIPADTDMFVLAGYLGGTNIMGGKMKETGYDHWSIPNPASNSSGFTALGGSYRDASWNTFNHLTNNAYFWTSTLSSPGGGPWYWKVRCDSEWVERDHNLYRSFGFSVRCLKDN
ncbi:MAG: hypothetical protein NTU44_05055 [Bacteroidetes bacterium]|nr:hypothetical protein [Bacteroidota bacterium]